jgi:predicted RND superfamily exporter protein
MTQGFLFSILVIAFLTYFLHRSWKMVLVFILPNMIPLLIIAGIMGFAGIELKAATSLVFSIAFGISSDGTVYLLTKYRQELLKTNGNATLAISNAIKDTGLSMIYTSVILFFGFSIFSVSSFGGTAALGILISLTLLISLFTNLILLPAILLSINSKKQRKLMMETPIVELED